MHNLKLKSSKFICSRPKSKNQLQLKVRINPKTEVINKSQNQISGNNTEENQVQNKPQSAWKNPPPTPMSLLPPTKSKFRIRSPTPGPSKSKSETKSQVLRIKSNASQVIVKPESSQNSKVRTRSRSSQIREIRKM